MPVEERFGGKELVWNNKYFFLRLELIYWFCFVLFAVVVSNGIFDFISKYRGLQFFFVHFFEINFDFDFDFDFFFSISCVMLLNFGYNELSIVSCFIDNFICFFSILQKELEKRMKSWFFATKQTIFSKSRVWILSSILGRSIVASAICSFSSAAHSLLTNKYFTIIYILVFWFQQCCNFLVW